MANPAKLYQQEMHRNLGFFATWLPGDPIEIGDAGVFEGGRFRRMSSLLELGIQCETNVGESTQDLQYTSTNFTKISTSGGAKARSIAKAEIAIEFGHEGAFVFHVSGMRVQRLENRTAVANQIMKAYRKDHWAKEWMVVEALHIADRATIIVSEETSAGLVLTANANAPLPAISLADPKIDLAVTSTRGKLVHIIGANKIHPLYSCLYVRDPLIGSASVQPVRGEASEREDVMMARPGIEDLLNS